MIPIAAAEPLPAFVAVYVADNTLTLPSDDQPIWRYVTFTKMVAMLLDRVLHFSRADMFLDRFEIGIPARDMAAARQWTAAAIADGTISRDGLMAYLAAMADQPRAAFERMAVDQLVAQTMRYTSRALFVSRGTSMSASRQPCGISTRAPSPASRFSPRSVPCEHR